MHYLFVYGTLKRGYGNNHRLLQNAHFQGEAISVGNYKLLNTGVPLLNDDEHGAPVRGELYQVNDVELMRCDQLEGHPHDYERKERDFTLADGTRVTAWVYLWSGRKKFAARLQQPAEDGVLEWHYHG
jgi:gamma-glutamylcyclotransferase (GGCT)/AIG2-like uncharacterized protein YtfP